MQPNRVRGWRAPLAIAIVALSLLAWTPLSAPSPYSRSSSEDDLTALLALLRSDLEGIVGPAAGRWRTSQWSILAVSLDRGDTLFALNPSEALAPASNLKLLTTATAIQRLGRDFRYQTFLLSTGSVAGGRLNGDLVLYGTGDPGLSGRFRPGGSAVFEAFADSLLAAGIHVVTGDVVGDGSYFTGPLLAQGWNPDDLNDAFAAPSAALAFNENVFQIRVRASGRAGDAPEILTIPENAGVAIQNEARIGGSGPLHIRRNDPIQAIVVQGGVAPGGREVWRQLTVPDPAHFSASILRSVLERKGIHVLGSVRSAYDREASTLTGRRLWAPGLEQSPAPRVLARHLSPPLVEYLSVVNKRSHNLLADQILKTVGRLDEGEGSYEGGGRAVSRFMADSVGAEIGQLTIHDGSGLSSMNRVSAADFVSLMSYMAERGDWNTLWETLPEAGNPRELRRMYQTGAAGNLRAKTGTIQNVSSLSGMVRSVNGERIAFSIIANQVPSTSGAKGIEDRIGTRLAAFDRPFLQGLVESTLAASADSAAFNAEVASVATSDGLLPPTGTAANGDGAATDGGATSDGVAQSSVAGEGSGARTHQVRAGENFSVIARRYGVPVNALVEANPEVSPRRLQPGMQVKIP